MARLTVGGTTPAVSREKREDALERLLLLACQLLPDDLSELGEENMALAEQVTGEAAWWLDFAPRGVKPAPTDPKTRLGAKEVAERRAHYRLEKRGKEFALVPVSTPTTPKKEG